MRLRYIVNQLRAILPKYTTKFNKNNVSISSLTSSGSTVTATSTGHGFSVGNYVLINGAKVPYAVSSLTRVGTQATVITSTTNQIIYQKDAIVEITGANQSDYNGTKTLIEPKIIKISSLTKSGNTITAITEEDHGFIVNANFKIKIWGSKQAIYNQESITVATTPDSTTFTYTVEGETTSPAVDNPEIYCQALYTPYVFFFEVENSPATPATGTIYNLISFNGGYNGFYRITAKTDNTFTYTMNLSGLNSPAQGTIKATTVNIDSAISLDRAEEAYTKQTTSNYWLFIVPATELTSKNTREITDANYVFKPGNSYQQRIMYTFDLLLFIPSTSSLANGDSWDLAQDMKPYIFKSIVGVFLDSDFDEGTTTGISYIGSTPEIISSAFYIHRFSFEVTSEIKTPDIIDEYDTFAFRAIEERYIDENKEDTGLDTVISL